MPTELPPWRSLLATRPAAARSSASSQLDSRSGPRSPDARRSRTMGRVRRGRGARMGRTMRSIVARAARPADGSAPPGRIVRERGQGGTVEVDREDLLARDVLDLDLDLVFLEHVAADRAAEAGPLELALEVPLHAHGSGLRD